MMIVYSTFSYLVRDNTRHFQKLNENLNVVIVPSTTGYLMPLRAINTAGKWRIVVNGVKAHYETLTQVQSVNSTTQKFDPILSLQTARVEECSTPGSPCPLVPACYDTHCVQVGCHVQAIFMLKILFSPRIYLRHKAIFMLLKILFLSLRNRSTTGSWCTTPTTSISRLPLRLSSCRPAARATMEPSLSLIKVFFPPRL